MGKYDVAIVGATGLVGRELLKIIQQRNFPIKSLNLFASDRSAGQSIKIGNEGLDIREIASRSFEGIDVAFFSAGADVSRQFSPVAARSGAIVIDSSDAFRMSDEVPLIIPEVNADDIAQHKGTIASPDCPTIQIAVALHPLHKVNPLRRVIVDTYQSVAGTGRAAIEELSEQSRQILEGRSIVPHVYPHQIAFNLLPEIDLFLDSGYTRAEWRLAAEVQRIMHAGDIAISATCVRVPVLMGYSAAAHVEFTDPISPGTARRIMAEAPGVKVLDDPSIHLYPQPWSAAGTDDVFVGRIRRDNSHSNGLAMWIVTDNLRKGAALNAVQIAETMIQRGWL